MLKPLILAVCLVVVGAQYQSYLPRGWRPAGPPFEPTQNVRSQTSAARPTLSYSYGVPVRRPTAESLPTTTVDTLRTTEIVDDDAPRTTTPRSREPTTSHDLDDDQDYDTGPTLAIANSFAFNRPVYVYNGYPFHSALTFVK